MANNILIDKKDWERVCRAVRDIEELKVAGKGPASQLPPYPFITTLQIDDAMPVEGTSNRFAGVYINAPNLFKSDEDPLWSPPDEEDEDGNVLDPIPALVTALDGGTLEPGSYFCIQAEDTQVDNPDFDPDDDTSGPETFPRSQFIAITGTSISRIPLVHVVGGDFHPVNGGTDEDDWYVAEVFRNEEGNLEEVVPRIVYGNGLVDADGTGWVYEASGYRPWQVDPPNEDFTPTHSIPLFRDYKAEADEDGPIYVIDYGKQTETLDFVQDADLDLDTCTWTKDRKRATISSRGLTIDLATIT